jgi:hypothetical protein
MSACSGLDGTALPLGALLKSQQNQGITSVVRAWETLVSVARYLAAAKVPRAQPDWA